MGHLVRSACRAAHRSNVGSADVAATPGAGLAIPRTNVVRVFPPGLPSACSATRSTQRPESARITASAESSSTASHRVRPASSRTMPLRLWLGSGLANRSPFFAMPLPLRLYEGPRGDWDAEDSNLLSLHMSPAHRRLQLEEVLHVFGNDF